jgi:hypothetical protein
MAGGFIPEPWAASAGIRSKLKGLDDLLAPIAAELEKHPGQIGCYITPTRSSLPRPASPPNAEEKSDATLTGPQRELLAALAWWRDMGHTSVTRAQLAAKAGWKAKGSHLRNRLSELRTGELIEYRSDAIALTPAGNAVAPQPDLGVSLVDSIRAALNGPQREVFNGLLELGRGGPAVFSREELAERLGWDAAGSHLRNRLSELAPMAIVEYPARGQVALQGWVR